MDSNSSNRANAGETIEFTYEDTPISRRGDLLNLTQMWIANGRLENRQPAQWLRLPATRRFLRKLRQKMFGVADLGEGTIARSSRNAAIAISPKRDVGLSHFTFGPDSLLVVEHGRKADDPGSTWAHWQLALVYAHYLSPDFYIWCNEVVHNAMERFGGPSSGPARPTAALFGQFFGQLHKRLDVLGQYACDNLLLTAAVQQLPGKRLEFTTRTRSIICAVVAAVPFDDQCPCCSRRPVLSPAGKPANGAEFDHFYGASLNRPEYGWLICRQCHDDFTNGSPLLRLGHIPVFHVFQGQVLDYLVNHRSVVTPDP